MGRTAAKVDANQPEIVDWFRGLGCTVHCAHGEGDGFTDLVVGCWGQTTLVEVKDHNKPPSARKLTPDQVIFHRDWKGSIFIVETVQQATDVVKWLKSSSILLSRNGNHYAG